MIIFEADHPRVLDGTYDREGYTPKERRAQQRKLTEGDDMAKRKAAAPKKTITARTKSGKARRGGRWQTVARAVLPAPKPRARALPGMEDHAILELEHVAVEYAEIRDRRMELTKEESDLKASAMKAMKRHGKTIYKHGGVTIQIVSGEDDVKVRVKKAGDEDEDDDEPAGETGASAEFSDERRAAVESDNGADVGHHYPEKKKRGRKKAEASAADAPPADASQAAASESDL